MKIEGSRVLESTLTKSQQPNLMLITHISNSFKPILGMFYFCFKNCLNHSMNPFFHKSQKMSSFN
jgi:hypothetical protein